MSGVWKGASTPNPMLQNFAFGPELLNWWKSSCIFAFWKLEPACSPLGSKHPAWCLLRCPHSASLEERSLVEALTEALPCRFTVLLFLLGRLFSSEVHFAVPSPGGGGDGALGQVWRQLWLSQRGALLAEARDTAKHPTAYRTTPQQGSSAPPLSFIIWPLLMWFLSPIDSKVPETLPLQPQTTSDWCEHLKAQFLCLEVG